MYHSTLWLRGIKKKKHRVHHVDLAVGICRPVHQIITMIKWIRTSRLSIKNSLWHLRQRRVHDVDRALGICLGLRLRVQLLRRNVNRFRGGLVFEARRLVYHSTLGLRVIQKKKHRVHHVDGALGIYLGLRA